MGAVADIKRLVIVESPAKAKTIASYLGPGYIVDSSLGHIRDLPRNAKEIPAKYKDKAWSRLGVDVDNDFAPLYIVNPDRSAHVKKLKGYLAEVDEVFLATDEDREGEAIAWHLLETLKPKVPVKRMVFHEITPQAIAEAAANPRELNQDLVDAQEARRILDRLYGYEVSPVLWKKVMPRLSAGRVQSVATRIVVERERARMAFRTADYWDVTASLATDDGQGFKATLIAVDGDRVASGKDFDAATGRVKGNVVHLDESGARGLARRLEGRDFTVLKVEKKPYRRKPYPPFITSTLQQEAGRKLRLSSAQVMRVAQRLYENGHITYMRTDSTNLSNTAINAARAHSSASIPAHSGSASCAPSAPSAWWTSSLPSSKGTRVSKSTSRTRRPARSRRSWPKARLTSPSSAGLMPSTTIASTRCRSIASALSSASGLGIPSSGSTPCA